VVLVRHAETRSDGTRDPSLTAEGRARAEALAAALSDAKVTAVVTSSFRRTRETGAPTAAFFELEPSTVAITREGGLAGHVASVTESVHSAPEGVVLVVGHSNTVPRIVAALGGPAGPDLAEDDHASLFTLVLHDEGPAWCLRSELALPSDPAAP
jgi:broad specificity phosphatase PhoE